MWSMGNHPYTLKYKGVITHGVEILSKQSKQCKQKFPIYAYMRVRRSRAYTYMPILHIQ